MHPTDRQLIDFALAEAGETDRVRVERHLAGECRQCAELVARYRELLEIMRTDETPEPPAVWVERAIALGRPSWSAKVREWCGNLREELGRVIQDSLSAPELVPVRVRHVAAERRLCFESGDVELDVRVEPLGRDGVVTGQFVKLGPPPDPLAGVRYLLTAGAPEAVAGTTDDFGEFSEELSDLTQLRIRVVAGERLATFEVPGAPGSDG